MSPNTWLQYGQTFTSFDFPPSKSSITSGWVNPFLQLGHVLFVWVASVVVTTVAAVLFVVFVFISTGFAVIGFWLVAGSGLCCIIVTSGAFGFAIG